MTTPVLLVVLCALYTLTSGQLVEHISGNNLLPYGINNGDERLYLRDDDSSDPIDIPISFPFFNNAYNRFWINANGMLSFRHPIRLYKPRPFPLDYENGIRSMIAPFWSDVNLRKVNIAPDARLYHREVVGSLLQTVSDEIPRVFGTQYRHFEATWGYLVTWHRVTYDGGRQNDFIEENTFQVMLLTDGFWSFALFNYGDMEWSVGSNSNGRHAQVGYDTGDDEHFFSVPNSGTPDIVNIEGTYIMRLDVNVPSSAECTIDGVSTRVRLAQGGQGNVMQGNAEVRINGEWKSICDRGWGDEDATVFCTQLGFPGPATAYRNAEFGSSIRNLPFVIEKVRCSEEAEERCIMACRHDNTPSSTECQRGDEAGVKCFGAPTNELVIRLSGSQDPREGNVEVKVDGNFYKICDDGWSDADADIVCKELEYAGGVATRNAFFGERPQHPFGFERVSCEGDELSIAECVMAPAGNDCVPGNEAGVVCFGAEHPIRLFDGEDTEDDNAYGQVEMRIGTKWYKVCDVGWNELEAQIVCEELGYLGTATAVRGSPESQRNGLDFFTFKCEGDENKLFDCLKPLRGHQCDGGAAAVNCSET